MLVELDLDIQKEQTVETSDCGSRDMLNFWLLKKDLRLCFSPYFVHDFLRDIFVMPYSIKVACRVRVAYLKE